ncbi:polyphenol oxidase family protein [Helicobacter sp. MIT 14-3879]|uniref:polyphenol oxidase family protein n=1 Tax=Helicobacter sp. MIT 14-3879 TaxID=2040649 RepID=UPI000E1E50F1|nr:polyphenol oxidase family protein [Helicobacter sp. MIT 14-3879]RDU62899.1 hypothetical protein CQA44_06280 [Helicobacter sp. MIT 14-3879]
MIAYSSKDSILFKDKPINFYLTDRFDNKNGILNLNINDISFSKNFLCLNTFLKTDKIHYLKQIHSNKIISLNTNSPILLGEGDAIFCSQPNLYAMVFVADCNPILLYTKHKFILLHAGRAGLEQNIISKAFLYLKQKNNFLESEIIAFVGASIRSCCYEINGELLQIYKQKYNKYLSFRNNRYYLNMIDFIEDEFRLNGITNFEIYPKCTCCDDSFFSYRRDRFCGRFCLIASLK